MEGGVTAEEGGATLFLFLFYDLGSGVLTLIFEEIQQYTWHDLVH
jgi:hypothetical protein